MRIKVIRDIAQLSDYRDAWNKLLVHSSNNHVFLTYEWLRTWWDVYGADKELLVLVVEDENGLLGIAPLYLETKKVMGVISLKQLFFVGNRHVGSDFLNFIIYLLQ